MTSGINEANDINEFEGVTLAALNLAKALRNATDAAFGLHPGYVDIVNQWLVPVGVELVIKQSR
jgi:hypothetical protein